MITTEQTVRAKPLVKLASMLAKIVYPVSEWLSFLSIISVAAMMLMVTADVFMRRAFNSPIFGTFEITKVLLVIVVFCAVAYVMRFGGHVFVDSLARLYPRKMKIIMTGIAQFFSLIILALICWQSINYGIAMLRVGENLVLLRIPVSPFIFLLSFGYAIFSLVVLVQFIYTLAGVDEDTGQLLSSSARDHGQR